MRSTLGRVFVTWALLALSGGCRCRGFTNTVESGFRADESTVDFGRALEGTQVGRDVTLHATGRADVTVAVQVSGPFTAPDSVVVPGGSEVKLPVTFTAGAGKQTGTLQLDGAGEEVLVTLVGVGVHPLDCKPSAQCRVARFDLDSNGCVESVAADGTGCIPASVCLENGLCQGGACVGSPRTCDDKNACTDDACSEAVGCVHTPVQCPPPSAPCRMQTCDVVSGCGETTATDGTACGTLDCVTSNLCISGVCKAISTPDGVVCGVPTPCQSEPHCQAHVCRYPDAGEMVPWYTVPLPLPPAEGEPGAPRLLAYRGNLFWEMCAAAGEDGGCALTSYTGSGFERFTVPQRDGRPRQLGAVSDAGVVVLAADALESYSAATGTPQWQLPFASLAPPASWPPAAPQCRRDQLALGNDSELYALFHWQVLPPPDPGPADGGTDGGEDAGSTDAGGAPDAGYAWDGGTAQSWVLIGRDGGVVTSALREGYLGHGSLALQRDNVAWYYEPTGALVRATLDGGAFAFETGAMPAGEPSLLTWNHSLFAGARHLLDVDGGAPASGPSWNAEEQPLPRHSLASFGTSYVFYRACVPPAPPACADADKGLFVRALFAGDGGVAWEAQVLPENAPGRLEEAALVTSGLGVLTLTQIELSGEPNAHVQMFSSGQRLFVCPLPRGGTLGGALFDSGRLYAFVQRQGLWYLEAYDLSSIPLETYGWPQRFGVSGTRRAR